LNDSDIPHRTTIRKRVEEVYHEHLKKIKKDMAAAVGKVSTTMDVWTDSNMRSFMAITAHWIESVTE
ncbi:uncharacterized protein SCHCODRAFT_02471500, partial [Schizophyllum commune H4-8]|uniref:uncharacterized protein n=1 Tax=Schizophyllum commune (strain H4-8 / FGSC 9210) TaxID=578458 RepID=UPI00215FB582